MISRKLLSGDNCHIFICGLTQSGKSYFAHRALAGLHDPVLYCNIQGEEVPRGFVTVHTSRADLEQLIDLLQHGAKVNLVFDDMGSGYNYTIADIIARLMVLNFSRSKPVYVAIDECHLLSGKGLKAARVAATAGLKKGIRLVCITQRVSLCDKTLYTQAFEHYIFYIPIGDGGYMKTKGIDYDKCLAWWSSQGDIKNKFGHSYMYFNGYELTGKNGI